LITGVTGIVIAVLLIGLDVDYHRIFGITGTYAIIVGVLTAITGIGYWLGTPKALKEDAYAPPDPSPAPPSSPTAGRSTLCKTPTRIGLINFPKQQLGHPEHTMADSPKKPRGGFKGGIKIQLGFSFAVGIIAFVVATVVATGGLNNPERPLRLDIGLI